MSNSNNESKDSKESPPTIEQYTNIKNQLTQQILKKQELDQKLNKLEDLIYEKENEYFNESTYGNIVKGFDHFTKNNGGGSNKKRIQYTDEDHIFSLSSSNYIKTLMKRQGLSTNNSSTSKEDLDDYEDSIDPGNQNSPISSSNNYTSTASNSNVSIAGTPGRKRKPRTFDD